MGAALFRPGCGKEYSADTYFGIDGGGDMPNSKPRTNFLHRADETPMVEKISLFIVHQAAIPHRGTAPCRFSVEKRGCSVGAALFRSGCGKEYAVDTYFGIAGGGDVPNSKPRTNFLHRADETPTVEKISFFIVHKAAIPG
jgi:hypothetical protein